MTQGRRDRGMFRFREAGRFLRDLAAGIAAPAVAATTWRQRRLLVLGYHGISLADEHLWDGTIYMSPETFRRRLNILRETGCEVLPLGVAVRQLFEGTLPPRSVALVFDDGFSDFARVAAPILAEFGYPATVYLCSYYAGFNRPIFDIMLRYLLWKGAQQSIALPGILSEEMFLDEDGQRNATEKLRAAALENQMTAGDKDKLLAEVAKVLDLDYQELCRERLLHTMNAEEVRAMNAQGYDIELHTHRHRVSRKQELFAREIHDNRQWIRQTIGGADRVHFSFPGGVWEPVEQEWLTDLGVETALTCVPALADGRCNKLSLPRFVDNAHVGERAFRAWLAGSMSFFPKGTDNPTEGQILEETIHVRSDVVRAVAARAGG